MNEGSSYDGSSYHDQNARSNSSSAYLQRAASAVNDGDIILGIHLYLAAYERALRENRIPNEEVLAGMRKAWDLALRVKQRSLAEYIFEKLEPFWSPEEMAHHAEELQKLAFDKLEEFGFDRSLVEDVADMVSQDLIDPANDVLYRFDGDLSQGSGLPMKEAKHAERSNPTKLSESLMSNEGPSAELSSSTPADDRGSAGNEVQSANSSAGEQKADHSARNASDAQDTSSDDGVNESSASKTHVGAVSVPPDSPLAAAFAQLSSMALGSSQQEVPASAAPKFDYRNLVGFDRAIDFMGKLGVGKKDDPEFGRFLEMLNFRHGLSGMPGLGTLIFRSPAREDANCFMVATVGELGLPAIRMRLDRNAMGQVVLCVMASPDFKTQLSNVSRIGFEGPTVVVLEDLDLWDLPFLDGAEDMQSLLSIQLSRGAREALALVQAALMSTEATVLISASEPSEIDPFFWDMIGHQRVVDIELPNERERRAIWLNEQSQHPSMRGLNVGRLVDFSRTLSRFEIYAISNEAVEEAYRRSVERNTFCAVETGDILMRLASFMPLDSDEYKHMEDLAVESFSKELLNLDDLLKE